MLVVLSLLAHGLTLEIPQVEVFYVKPTVPLTTECPSGDSPCHSLQCYANHAHSNFTNNSRFLFLEGEHSVVTISNVANLSLVGISSEVEILCKSIPSEFHVETFVRLNIEMMSITNCTGSENISPLSLWSGLDMSLNDVTISGNDTVRLAATNVVGIFSIFASTFISPPQGSHHIIVDYFLCKRHSYLNFSKNKIQF